MLIRTRKVIEQEIRKVRAGAKSERHAAYGIDFQYRDRDSYTCEGRSA